MDLTTSEPTVSKPKTGETLLWAIAVLASGAWAFTNGQKLFFKYQANAKTSGLAEFFIRNSGASALAFATVLVSLVALAAAIQAARGRALPARAASVLLVTVMALRAVQIFSQGSATVADSQILAGLTLLSAVTYWGATSLWWFVLMPLATAAMLTPLIVLEFFKGASHAVLTQSVSAPATAWLLTTLLIITRELRSRANSSLLEMSKLHSRGATLKKQMHHMETDLKSLLTMISISRPAVLAPTENAVEFALAGLGEDAFVEVPAGPVRTTEFAAQASAEGGAIESTSYEDIDRAAREILEEARMKRENKTKIRLLLTAPVGSTLPLVVRGELSNISRWLRALVANSVDSLGGFPDGVVRVSLRPGLTSLLISIEDNGRGFNDDLLTKLGASSAERMSSQEVGREVEAAGGRFDIQARLGVGSRLTIELPRVDQPASSSVAKPERAKAFKDPGGFRPNSSNSPLL